MQIDGADACCHAVELGVVPGDGKRDGRIEEHTEIVPVVGILPKIIRVDDHPTADALLQSDIELIAITRLDRRRLRAEDILRQTTPARPARQDQVLIERRFESARISTAQHRVLGYQVRQADARLDAVGGRQPVILILAKSSIDGEPFPAAA